VKIISKIGVIISILTFSTLLFAQNNNLKWLTISKDYCMSNGYGNFKDGICFASYGNARKTCKNLGGRLPTIDELEREARNICGLKEGMSFNQRKAVLKTEEYKKCIKSLPFFSRNSYWSSTEIVDGDNQVYMFSFVRAKKYQTDMYSTEWNEYHARAVSCINDETSVKKIITPINVYEQCKGCHGEKGERKALNKSKVIKDMSKEEIIAALKGYSNGTYGSSLKGLMKLYASKLTEKDMEAIVDYLDIR